MESTSACPRYRRWASSTMPMTQRVRELPVSRPTANCGLTDIRASFGYGGDAIVDAEIEGSRAGRPFVDRRIFIEECLHSRSEVFVAEHKQDVVIIHLLAHLYVVVVGNIDFGDAGGQPAELRQHGLHLAHLRGAGRHRIARAYPEQQRQIEFGLCRRLQDYTVGIDQSEAGHRAEGNLYERDGLPLADGDGDAIGPGPHDRAVFDPAHAGD